MRVIPDKIKTILKSRSMIGSNAPTAYITFADILGGIEIRCTSVSLSRSISANSQRCRVTIPNVNPSNMLKVGYYSPESDNSGHPNLIKPGCEVTITIGYGTSSVRVFTGEVDDVDVLDDAGDCTIDVDCRDNGAWINDKRVMDGSNYYVQYTEKTIEFIVNDLLTKAGFTSIVTESTGITVSKLFERVTYSEAIEWCLTVSGFELIIDDYGGASFRLPNDRQPVEERDDVTLSTSPTELEFFPVVTASIIVMNREKTILYTPNVDYVIAEGDDETPWTLTLI